LLQVRVAVKRGEAAGEVCSHAALLCVSRSTLQGLLLRSDLTSGNAKIALLSCLLRSTLDFYLNSLWAKRDQ
jgi:hypothetical protein